jgi:hypothetical protein
MHASQSSILVWCVVLLHCQNICIDVSEGGGAGEGVLLQVADGIYACQSVKYTGVV